MSVLADILQGFGLVLSAVFLLVIVVCVGAWAGAKLPALGLPLWLRCVLAIVAVLAALWALGTELP